MATQKKYQVHGYGNIAYDLDALVKERALDDAGRMYEHSRWVRSEEHSLNSSH